MLDARGVEVRTDGHAPSGGVPETAMKSYSVRDTLATKLVAGLVEVADEKHLHKTIARYGRVDLLCIDELGLHGTRSPRRRTPLPSPHRTREKEQRRHHLRRILPRLDQAFIDPRLCAAVVDRLTFNGTGIENASTAHGAFIDSR